MKKSVYLIAILYSGIIFSQPPSSVNSDATKYAETITVADLKEDLTILASDALEGRETGKRGQKMAAAYIKTHFEELGLVGPVKGTGSPYYQNVPLKVVKPGSTIIKLSKYKTLSTSFSFMSMASAIRLGRDFKNQMWATGHAKSI